MSTRRLYLQRNQDPTGVSGTGVVAEGVEFSDGTVVLRWNGEHQSTVVWSCLADAIAVHGHDGATEFMWVDGPDTDPGLVPKLIEAGADGLAEELGLGRPYDWSVPVQIRMDVARLLSQRGITSGPTLAAEVIELSEVVMHGRVEP